MFKKLFGLCALLLVVGFFSKPTTAQNFEIPGYQFIGCVIPGDCYNSCPDHRFLERSDELLCSTILQPQSACYCRSGN